EDIAPEGNAMVDYVAGLAQNLYEADKRKPDGTLSDTSTRASWLQSRVSSVHFYPFVIVLEKPETPVAEFPVEKRGTQWHPWVFRQRQFIRTGGGPDDAAASESLRIGEVESSPGESH